MLRAALVFGIDFSGRGRYESPERRKFTVSIDGLRFACLCIGGLARLYTSVNVEYALSERTGLPETVLTYPARYG